MKIFAISDLHLSGKANKPMNVFGDNWEGHFEKIKADWEQKVSRDDVVLIGGDTSWGMYLDEGMYDVHSLAPLKGKKVFVRGNHDYWWSAMSKVRAAAPEGFIFLQNDCVKIGKFI
ncbi:MAG: metallophosphoesterase, partial [Clostridiales bacterium]|nr:metallophosphoesterase [Clostridiales bacterium]